MEIPENQPEWNVAVGLWHKRSSFWDSRQQLSGKVYCRKRFPLNAVELGVCFNVFLAVGTQ